MYKKNLGLPISLILITQRQSRPLDQYLKFIERVAKNGISCVQLREKNASVEFLLEFGQALNLILKPLAIPLMVNDNLDLALQLNADGIHLGQQDINPSLAREVLGPDKIIGLSIESMVELKCANQLNCLDYIAASAVFPTQTKANIKTIWGLDGLAQVVKLAKYPVVGIGGINLNNLDLVLNTGIHGVALISAIHNAPDPEQYVAQLRHTKTRMMI